MSLEQPLAQAPPAPSGPTPSLAEAYTARHGFDGPTQPTTPEPEAETEKQTRTLSDVDDMHRERVNSADARAERRRQLRAEKNTLADAHDQVSHEEEIERQLEDEAEEAARLNDEVATFASAFESEDESESEEPEAEETEEEEQTSEEEPETEPEQPEEPKQIPLPETIKELLAPGNEEVLKAFDEQTQATFQRSQETSQPIMVDLLTQSLAQTMGTDPEYVGKLRDVVSTLNFAAQSFVEAAVPRMIQSSFEQFAQNHFGELLEAYAPGLRESFIEAQAANTWQSVIESEEFSGMNLPAYGSKEFFEAAEKLYAASPWLNDFDPVGPDNKPLPAREALRVKAEVCARLLKGERLSPKAVLAQVNEAAKTAKEQSERHARRVSAARSLGHGRSTGSLGSENSDRQSLIDAYRSHPDRGGF